MNNGIIKQKSRLIKDCNDLKLGNCICCIKDRYTGKMRYAEGSVAKIPYTSEATPENKAKYGKNMVYVLYRDYEDIVGYYQNRVASTVSLSNEKYKARSGDFYSINTVRARGHKGELRDVKKNGTAIGVIVTHSPYTRGRKNIELCENPQPNDERKAYLVSTPEHINVKKHVGKYQPNMRITNALDKSKVRNVAKRK